MVLIQVTLNANSYSQQGSGGTTVYGVKGNTFVHTGNYSTANFNIGVPYNMLVECRDGSESGVTITSTNHNGFVDGNNPDQSINFDFSAFGAPGQTVVIVATMISTLSNQVLKRVTKSMTFPNPSGGGGTGGSTFSSKWILIGVAAIGVFMVLGKKIKW